MKKISQLNFDPYQLLFPLGLIHAVIGIAVWILFPFQWIDYPRILHTHHMFTGFLLSFAAGFLLTAIPRFTGSEHCSWTELMIASFISFLSFYVNESMMSFAMLFFLLIFFIRRFASKVYSPPPHFLFLPLGLALGLAGSALAILCDYGIIEASFRSMSILLLYYGTMSSFLLGIGAKLISALLGWSSPPSHRNFHQIETFHQKEHKFRLFFQSAWIPTFQVFIFASGFVFELTTHAPMGRALRAICATWIAIQNWKLYRKPKAKGKLPFWIWISAWMLIMGFWLHTLFPSLGVHAAHIIFISGYGLMTLMVASRVTLAHGGHPLEIETNAKVFGRVGILTLIAVFTRLSAPWTHSYVKHLAYAAVLWMIAMIIWGIFFVPRMFLPPKEETYAP